MAKLLKSTISSSSGEFSDVSAESNFAQSKLKINQVQLRTALLFCSAVYLGFIVTDVSVLGFTADAARLLIVRTSVVLIAAIGCWLLSQKPASVSVTWLVACAAEIVGMTAFLFIQWIRPAQTAWHAMSMALMLLVVYLYIPNRLVYSIAIAVASTCAFVAMVLEQGRLLPHEVLTMIMLLLLANTFGFIAARRYNILWREEFRAQLVLKNASMQDPLTGCYNRQYLQQALFAPEIARAIRFKLQLTVIMCDLDNFKSINDSYGHTAGDAVLIEFSKVLLNTTREDIDTVVRFGGEEFLIVLPETGIIGGAQLAERLRAVFSESAVLSGSHLPANTTASFGVASIDFGIPESVGTMTDLISYADQLLYAAKEGGRNRVVCGQLNCRSDRKSRADVTLVAQ